mmetsp:Transcript_32793/g.53536  ORF Transcript_32793/g.53536 Transcript_32793/m.53536 type:complete len:100 (-) Transcript_32793:95-394(-)
MTVPRVRPAHAGANTPPTKVLLLRTERAEVAGLQRTAASGWRSLVRTFLGFQCVLLCFFCGELFCLLLRAARVQLTVSIRDVSNALAVERWVSGRRQKL